MTNKIKTKMGLKYSKNRLESHLTNKKTMDSNRPNKGTIDDIINFPNYLDKYTPCKGSVNGPELYNEKVYLSIYHFLEYEELKPSDYRKSELGLYLKSLTDDVIPCFYEDYDDKIYKYPYEFLKENESKFLNFKK